MPSTETPLKPKKVIEVFLTLKNPPEGDKVTKEL